MLESNPKIQNLSTEIGCKNLAFGGFYSNGLVNNSCDQQTVTTATVTITCFKKCGKTHRVLLENKMWSHSVDK